MKTIHIEEDVYSYIAGQTQRIGEESPSEILRRLLGIKRDGRKTEVAPSIQESHEFEIYLQSTEFLALHSAIDKFLYILGIVYQEKKSDFEKILTIQGRNRRYFAKDKNEIYQSGESTQPKLIPNSPYWVMTNSSTYLKGDMLWRVLKIFGYSKNAGKAVMAAL